MRDYLMDENDDLQRVNGDFVRGYSNKQHQRALLIAEKGDYKQAPLATVGLASYLNDDGNGFATEALREIRLRFSDDGMTVKSIINMVIDADYGR